MKEAELAVTFLVLRIARIRERLVQERLIRIIPEKKL